MKKRILIVLIIIAAAALGFMLFRSNTANAPVSDAEKTKIASGQAEKAKASAGAAKDNNNKSMQGLEIKTTKEGTGDRAVKDGDTISVHYTGRLTDGTKFDSSIDRGTPFEFTVGAGMVIKGWELGFVGAKVGEKRTLTIPAELGYGSRGAGGIIPPNAILIFEVELVEIK